MVVNVCKLTNRQINYYRLWQSVITYVGAIDELPLHAMHVFGIEDILTRGSFPMK